MDGKYMTKQAKLACLSTQKIKVKDIHSLLAETIAERKEILLKWEDLFLPKPKNVKKDIHAELAETIAGHKRLMKQWEKLWAPKNKKYIEMADKQAAA